jgi:ABC-type branched-subunit amino acid transport system ATPase component
VTLSLWPGEVHALVGENGAGKSTLVRIIAGVHEPDAGEIRFDGRPVHLRSPADAQAQGVAIIYQEPTLFPDLSVAENVMMGRQPTVTMALAAVMILGVFLPWATCTTSALEPDCCASSCAAAATLAPRSGSLSIAATIRSNIHPFPLDLVEHT